MKEYNLIHEKWIPLRMLDGSYETLSILGTFAKLKEVAGVEDSSPLVVAAIYRFLLAVLYRALEGPQDIDAAEKIFKEGLPIEKIESYLMRWEDRFWLFDNDYPFGQIPDFEPNEWKPWTTLFAEHNADNAKVLFDHTITENAGEIPIAKAVCGLLAIQNFALGGGKSQFVNRCGAPSATAMMILPMGKNLEETLIFNLVPQNREICKIDLPIWEKKPDPLDMLKSESKSKRESTGFVDLYTWRSRAIRFQKGSKGFIGKVAFASGVKQSLMEINDPMLAYEKKKKNGEEGLFSVEFKERGVWREFDSILPSGSEKAPRVIEHAIELRAYHPQSIMVLGQATDQASVKFWRMEKFVLSPALLQVDDLRVVVKKCLAQAEELGKILYKTCQIYAEHTLSHKSKVDSSAIRNFVAQMNCIPYYWSTLESKFHNFLASLAYDCQANEVRYQWLLTLRDVLIDSWNLHEQTTTLSSVWVVRALIKANKYRSHGLKKIQNEIKSYEMQESK